MKIEQSHISQLQRFNHIKKDLLNHNIDVDKYLTISLNPKLLKKRLLEEQIDFKYYQEGKNINLDEYTENDNEIFLNRIIKKEHRCTKSKEYGNKVNTENKIKLERQKSIKKIKEEKIKDLEITRQKEVLSK